MQKHTFSFAAVLAAAFFFSMPTDATAEDGFVAPGGVEFPQVVNGLPTTEFPTTVAILLSDSTEPRYPDGRSGCTGTLIGCSTVLTAAHCVTEEIVSAGELSVFLQHGGIRALAVDSIIAHPEYGAPGTLLEDGGFNDNDIAVLTLAAPVTGIAPTPINTLGPVPEGSKGVIAGFGATRATAPLKLPDGSYLTPDSGLKRYGEVTTEGDCPLGDAHVCWKFRRPMGEPGLDSTSCHGDSGGPLFWNGMVAGITSYGRDYCSSGGADAQYTSVNYFQDWIVEQVGDDLGGLGCAESAAVHQVEGFSGALTVVGSQEVWSVVVPPGTESVRFASNGSRQLAGVTTLTLVPDYPPDLPPDLGRFSETRYAATEVDLYVRHGSVPTRTAHDCASARRTKFEYCEILDPEPGEWFVLVDSPTGLEEEQLAADDVVLVEGGEYQLTVTQLGAGPRSLELSAERDGVLASARPARNGADDEELIVAGGRPVRSVVAFDSVAIESFVAAGDFTRATLEMTLVGGIGGHAVDAHPLRQEFADPEEEVSEEIAEAALAPRRNPKRGLVVGGRGRRVPLRGADAPPGVTWSCAVDLRPYDKRSQCSPAWGEPGGDYGAATADSVQTGGSPGTVLEWDVTDDVLAGFSGWLLKSGDESRSGGAEFDSLEGAAGEGRPRSAPRLILE